MGRGGLSGKRPPEEGRRGSRAEPRVVRGRGRGLERPGDAACPSLAGLSGAVRTQPPELAAPWSSDEGVVGHRAGLPSAWFPTLGPYPRWGREGDSGTLGAHSFSPRVCPRRTPSACVQDVVWSPKGRSPPVTPSDEREVEFLVNPYFPLIRVPLQTQNAARPACILSIEVCLSAKNKDESKQQKGGNNYLKTFW